MQTRVVRYLEYINQKNKLSHERGEEILKNLSKRLRVELQQEFVGKVLQKQSILKNNFSSQFLKELAIYMRENTLAPGEIVYQHGENDPKMYYINQGEIEIYIDR